jgi:hypothetical protein
MTVHTICDNCGMEYVGPGVTVGGNIYCCAGCARGGPCTCGGPAVVTSPATYVAPDEVVASDVDVVVGPPDTVIIR